MENVFTNSVVRINGELYAALALDAAALTEQPDNLKEHFADHGYVVKADCVDAFIESYKATYALWEKSTLIAGSGVPAKIGVLRQMYRTGRMRLVNTFAYTSFADANTVINWLRAVEGNAAEYICDENSFLSFEGKQNNTFVLASIVNETRLLLKADYASTVGKLHDCDFPIQVVTEYGQDVVAIALECGLLPLWTLN